MPGVKAKAAYVKNIFTPVKISLWVTLGDIFVGYEIWGFLNEIQYFRPQ